MLDSFVGINDVEKQQLINAIAEITVLIAGADGTIDTAEIAWAEKLTKIRSYANDEVLNEYYGFVGDEFDETLNSTIKSYPSGTEERMSAVSNKLAQLNPILAKLDKELAVELYGSFISFAEHVAKASGGFLRMWSVSDAERKLMDLPMLDPIVANSEEEE